MEVSGQPHVRAALPQAKEPPAPIVQEAWWTEELVWTCGEEKNMLALPNIEHGIARAN
jgi:hypothetical protein